MTLTCVLWKGGCGWILALALLAGWQSALQAFPGLPWAHEDSNPFEKKHIGQNSANMDMNGDNFGQTDDANNKDVIWGNARHSYIQRSVGEKLKLQCDARMAGFELDSVSVVWELHLRRMSVSGCNPRDPVMTLAELTHVDSNFESDQIVSTINNANKGWTMHAEGAVLDADMSNAYTAWVGLTIENVGLEDSGTYRCEALVGEKDSSSPKQFKTSFTTLQVSDVSETSQTSQGFSHVTVEESIAATDHDSSVVSMETNHRYVGETAIVTCAPRLLRWAPTLPFSVKHLSLQFLPFWQSGSRFLTVAEYFADNDTFLSNPPDKNRWIITHHAISFAHGRNMDSLLVRIDLKILNATLQDTGIFDCAVTKATTGNTYHAEAGLKVTNDPLAKGGYCDPQMSSRGGGVFAHGTGGGGGGGGGKEGSDDLDLGFLEGAPKDKEKNTGLIGVLTNSSSEACMVAIVMLAVAILLMVCLCAASIYKACIREEEPPPMEPVREPVKEKKPGKKKAPPPGKKKEEPAPDPQSGSPVDSDWSPFNSYHFDYINSWLHVE